MGNYSKKPTGNRKPSNPYGSNNKRYGNYRGGGSGPNPGVILVVLAILIAAAVIFLQALQS